MIVCLLGKFSHISKLPHPFELSSGNAGEWIQCHVFSLQAQPLKMALVTAINEEFS
jgi:hypothetical protein